VLALVSACVSMKEGGDPTALMKVSGTEISAGEFRALGNELAIRIPAILETSGDRVLARTEDPLLRKHALGWKIEGVAAFHQALFRPDALGAAVETYALSVQVEDWVTGPGGQKAFGDLQPFIVDGAHQIRHEIEGHALAVAKDEAKARGQWNKIAAWAHENPIDENLTNRPSMHTVLAKIASNQDVGLVEAFSGISANVGDLATRVDVYAWSLPKVARWQAEMAAIDLTSADPGKLAVATLQRANGLITRVDGLTSPEAVQRLSEAATSSLRSERVAVMSDVDRQLRAMSEQLSREREAILGNVDQQRQATLADIDRKLDHAFDRSETMRVHLLADLEGIVARTIWRVFAAIAALLLLAGAVGYLLLRRVLSRSGPSGPSH
jgi:hypothetical protein